MLGVERSNIHQPNLSFGPLTDLLISYRRTPGGPISPITIPREPTLLVFDLDNTLVGTIEDSIEKICTILLHRLQIASDNGSHAGTFHDLDKPTKIDRLLLSLMVNQSLVNHVDPWDIAMQFSALMLSPEELGAKLNEQLRWAKGILKEETAPPEATQKQCIDFKNKILANNLTAHNSDRVPNELKKQPLGPENELYKTLTNMRFEKRWDAISPDLFKVYEFILRAIEVDYAANSRNRPIVPVEAFNAMISHISNHNVEVAVATNRPLEDAKELVGGLGLEIEINLICGRTDQLDRKPSPRMLEHLLAQVPRATNLIMIGDAHSDPETALYVDEPGVYGVGLHPPRSPTTFYYAKHQGWIVSPQINQGLGHLMNLPHLNHGALAVFRSTKRFIKALLEALGSDYEAKLWDLACKNQYSAIRSTSSLSP